MQMTDTGKIGASDPSMISTTEEDTLHDYDTQKRYQANLIEAVRLENPLASDKEIDQVA